MEASLPIKVEPSAGINYKIEETEDAIDYEPIMETEP